MTLRSKISKIIHTSLQCELFQSVNYFWLECELFWSGVSIILIILGAKCFSQKSGVPNVISLTRGCECNLSKIKICALPSFNLVTSHTSRFFSSFSICIHYLHLYLFKPSSSTSLIH